MIANTISSPTFRFLKVNSKETEFKDVNPAPFSDIQDSSDEIQKAFGGYRFGVSEEAIRQNRERANARLVYEVKRDENLKHIKFKLSDKNDILVDDIQIVSYDGVKSKFLIEYTNDGDTDSFRNSVLYVYGKKNSETNVHVVTNQNENSYIWHSIGFILEDNAVLNIYQTEIGVGKKLFSCMGKLNGEKSDFNLKGSYLLQNEESMDMLYNVDLYGRKSHTDILVNGVQKDFSHKTFKGTIDFKHGSKSSVGSEAEYVTLLDKTVVSKSVPILLCTEEDVVGNHASSAGQIDKNILFYIMSRGLSFDEAKSLIVKSRLVPVIDALPDKSLRDRLLTEIDNRMIKK